MIGRRSLAVAFALLGLVSCGDGPSAPNSEEVAIAGTYALTTVDSNAVPTTPATDPLNCIRSVDGGSLVLATNPQTYTMVVNLRNVCNAGTATASTTTPSVSETGDWELSGGVFTMVPFVTGVFSAPISTGSPTYVVPSITINVGLTWVASTGPLIHRLKFAKQ